MDASKDLKTQAIMAVSGAILLLVYLGLLVFIALSIYQTVSAVLTLKDLKKYDEGYRVAHIVYLLGWSFVTVLAVIEFSTGIFICYLMLCCLYLIMTVYREAEAKHHKEAYTHKNQNHGT